MIANSLVRRCADLTVTGLRTSLQLVDSRLPENSKARTGLRSALHLLDSVAHRGPSASAPQTETQPPADDAHGAASPHDEAVEEREAIAQAVRERQPNTGELADPQLDVADVQAELQAKHAMEERAEQQRLEEQWHES